MQSVVEEYFDGCDKSFFLNGLKYLKSQCESVLKLRDVMFNINKVSLL